MNIEAASGCELTLHPGLVWTPVRTKPRREKKLWEYCKNGDIVCYLPLRRTLHRYNRRTVEFRVPMFPSYVFCAINEDKYQNMLRSNCILYRINMQDCSQEVLLEELQAIQTIERMAEESELVVNPELVPGAAVSIVGGAMKGVKGIIQTRAGKTLLSVNIELLGQSVTAEFDAGDLEIDDDSV